MSAPNTTLRTVDDYMTDARVLLQDQVVPYRYEDPSLLTALNVAILEGYRVRPDLFLSYRGNLPTFTEVGATVVCIEQQFRLAFLFGLCAHAFVRDQEDIQDARYSEFMGTFYDILIGRRARAMVASPPPGGQE